VDDVMLLRYTDGADKVKEYGQFGIIIAKRNNIFHTLELPWLDNKRNVSCIPDGEYKTEFLEKSASGRYENVYWVKDVPGRSQILIHAGNFTKDTHGCILIGSDTGILDNVPALIYSRVALENVY